MRIDDLLAEDNRPDWFVPENWHMLLDVGQLPVLVKGPTNHAVDDEFAAMQFTYLNVGSLDISVNRVSTFYWDPVQNRSVLAIHLNSPFTLAAGTAFTCDRMVSRIELEAAL